MTSVLMVCLGNICRSPLAEGVLRNKATQLDLNIFVDSAGTSNYHIGQHPDKRSIAKGKEHGIDISQLKGRQFTVKDFDKFDLIYVMDSSNYSDVLSLARNESDKQKVELILNTVFPGSYRAVPDPYYGTEKDFENVYQLLDEACETIAYSLKKNKNR